MVTADLDLVGGAIVVRAVDHSHGEPQDAPLDRIQRVEIPQSRRGVEFGESGHPATVYLVPVIRNRLSAESVKNATHRCRNCASLKITCMATPSHDAIDFIDRAILDHLAANARATFGVIGKQVGLSAPAVKRRIDRLEQRGVILGYTVVLDHSLLERPLEAFIELRFTGDARVDAIASIGEGIPQVQAVFTMAGDPDALVWLRVSDVHDLKRVIDRLRSTGHVAGTKTMMVLGATKTPAVAAQSYDSSRRTTS